MSAVSPECYEGACSACECEDACGCDCHLTEDLEDEEMDNLIEGGCPDCGASCDEECDPECESKKKMIGRKEKSYSV